MHDIDYQTKRVRFMVQKDPVLEFEVFFAHKMVCLAHNFNGQPSYHPGWTVKLDYPDSISSTLRVIQISFILHLKILTIHQGLYQTRYSDKKSISRQTKHFYNYELTPTDCIALLLRL